MESSPVWGLILLAIVVGPIVAAIVQGIRHRESGAPKHDDASEAQAYVQIAKDLRDVQSGGRGW